MYRKTRFVKKIELVDCTKSLKFKRKLNTLDGQIIEYEEKFEFVKCTISRKFKGKSCTLDEQKVQIRGKIDIRWTYKIMKILWKIVFIKCTESPYPWNNSNL